MPNPIQLALYYEDKAHELFIGALAQRFIDEMGVEARISVLSARGGHSKMIAELEEYQSAIRSRQYSLSAPDLLLLARDANCESYARARRLIAERIDLQIFPYHVIACPDPHIERWFMADPESFCLVVGSDPMPGRRKCVRNYYKKKLLSAVKRGGNPALLGGIEFAKDLAQEMDLYRAGRNEPSLRHFADEFKATLRQLTIGQSC
jgi:hypothetical protein